MANRNNLTTSIRWIARISGSLILAFLLFFVLAYAFGEEESSDGFRNTAEIISFVFFPISTVLGLGLALKWEGLGGIITVIGMIGLFITRPDLLGNFYMAIPIIPGALYTAYWVMTKNK
ncbi:DUF7670 domain-containing protein [Robiginitalea sp. IMCC43444]|uniref:DUF7670 domain-containing protein n=1 Tax=Robiginitalea sp. IMCC43444 TaxID=3459121 RepID=UPI004041E447